MELLDFHAYSLEHVYYPEFSTPLRFNRSIMETIGFMVHDAVRRNFDGM